MTKKNLAVSRVAKPKSTKYCKRPNVEGTLVMLYIYYLQVEAIVVDDVGKMVVSLCLEGRIVSWDAYTGENLATIDRTR